MRYLRTNTATIVTVGPFYDKTDGVTIETGLTITNERISFVVDLNDGNAPTLVLDNVTGATGSTSNDLNYITNCDAGLMQLELAAANVNYLGRAFLTVTDAANHCPVFHEFTILPAMVYDSLILGTDVLQADMTQILGTAVSAPATAGILDINLKNIANAAVSTSTAQLGVNVVQISADATAADNAELFFDGTGYAGGTVKLGVDVVAISGDATAADNEEKFFDGTGYAGTNNVIPTVTTLTGHTAQTGDAYARLGAPVGASVSADVLQIKNYVDDIGAAGAGLTAIPWNAAWDAEVQSEATDALNAYDPPTNAEMEARTLVAADYVVVGDTLAAVTTVGSVTGAVGSVAANGITATSIAADAINAAAVKADAVTKIQSGLATAAALTVIDDFLDTEVAAILADTNELQTDWVNGGRLDLILDIIAADTTTDIPALINDLPTNAELATALGTADDAVLAELAKVPKSDSNVTWNATALASINAAMDTALDTPIPGSPTADSINERVATMDTSVALMRLLIATGTVVDDNDPDPTATAFETNLAEASNDHYNGAFLVFTSGALLGQSRKIAGYVGATKVITTSAFTEAPAGGDTFAILGRERIAWQTVCAEPLLLMAISGGAQSE